MAAAVRVLVVEDNADVSGCLALLLKHFGCDVRVHDDGEAALAEAAAYMPDLLLIDLAMPRMDGLTFAKRIRQRAEFSQTLMVAVSGYGDARHRGLSIEAGFNDCLLKPVAAEQYLALVERVRASHTPAGSFELQPDAGPSLTPPTLHRMS